MRTGLIARAVLAVIVAASVVACGDAGETATPAVHVVTDGAGRHVEVPVGITRVATVGSVPVLNSFPFAVGRGAAIVNGMPVANVDGYQSYSVLAPHLVNAPTVQPAIGQDVDAEKLLEAAPDVVFTSSVEVADTVQALGVPAVVLGLESGDNIRDSVRLVGEVLGAQDRAADYAAYFDDVVRRVSDIAATIPETARPTTLYVDTRPLRRPNRVMEWMLEQVGARSVTHDVEIGQYKFGVEQLLAWDPEVLIGMRPYDRTDLTQDQRFAGLRALRDNRLHIVPTGIQIWGNNTAEQPLALLWVARQVFPTYFQNIDMAAETKQFYHRFFAIDLTDAQVGDLLAARW